MIFIMLSSLLQFRVINRLLSLIRTILLNILIRTRTNYRSFNNLNVFRSIEKTLLIILILAGTNVAFDTDVENYTIPVSGKVVLTCYVQEVRSFKVLWQKIDRPRNTTQLTLIAFDGVVYSNKDHYRLESDYVGSHNLVIDRVSEEDAGEYQCQINTEPRKTKRIFLNVQVPPRIVDFRPNPPVLSAQAGSSLRLMCRGEGTPTPKIKWRIRDNNDLNNIDKPPDNSLVWFIQNIPENFPRTVECIADNGVLPASNRVFTINVEYAPIVIILGDVIQTQRYKNTTLICTTTSRPTARIYWEKDSRLIANDGKYSITTSFNQTAVISILSFQASNEDDFGKYFCIGENSLGRSDTFIFVLEESIFSTISTTTLLLSTTEKKILNYRHQNHDGSSRTIKYRTQSKGP
ncbi:unnamed protein product [Didymodactylos carnosus]|uniref:Ig-like domain-containing protein n=1 Tax=Didymodactylos carnosus TaxID=1234261 RepID=A0A814IR14_9BILA|nr:unnamed protein product [Didymodactylos carnosus]CAF1027312.1 unnamed protein product [Didymodactylos carnosus]CAF3639057.1 unnamed protein product [Didymodactylos carnosus]CAF3798293.1 unnamed protein product [Didymodactylos carnosus]